ncbi:MAG: hypothetical protein HOK06_03860 [Rhodospirillaceae bacterium]|jgi:glutamine---fructose-6-phosphate transaminase (isomerizing)|nr:hypothetical protein [Rhodospirillaceae bacterium]MBT4220137.1 hypothetical protein [Rhodospirillaceae bacterium]MBT4463235.1 hypothetical protein [Rhodospirillaceae bacterium]MBT5013254.1 hypothetical protein [Rhodospirillaceae bacterium]MBT5309602.1 hypothetical protein [Rhodospirillaceae bacterium]
MCGIFGLIAAKGATCNKTAFHGSLTELFRLSEPRGREASGLVIAAGGEAQVFKRPIAPSKMLASPDFKAFVKSSEAAYETDAEGKVTEPFAAIGHCRLVTNGTETVVGNNQPVISEHCVGVHNGIITNDEELWAANSELARSLDTDSEIVYRLIDKHMADSGDLSKAVGQAFGEMTGAASIGFFRNDTRAMTVATNTGSLYTLHLPDMGIFVFASEGYILEQFIKRSPLGGAAATGSVQRLTAGTGMIVGFDDAIPEVFSFDAPNVETPVLPDSLTIRDLTDHLADMQRCTKCILPESYPYIEFDDDGVCNFCHDYEPQKPEGQESLKQILEKHRSTDGSPDCIVAFSGGRDSSYGLHKIKTELGMNPIAFTYDWGMVTDIARRNTARMCGQLGVEHILRAADIPAKRRYIRKNIQAWLARPKLGMIPLFMAGDKMFFHYLRELRKETGIDLVLFCAGNEFERTDFKAGFAGVKENAHGNRLFGLSLANKVGLFAWYAWQYVLNPRYFNESFIDTMWAYFSTFIAKDDFTYLYHYLPWDEHDINKTLIGTYDWETAKDSDNTWRIGDGYTSFINYIYYTVAGFSEYDTFRSCQVREGLVSRDEALALVAKDNEPKMDVLYDFAKHTGFNLEEVLTRINSIEKLY